MTSSCRRPDGRPRSLGALVVVLVASSVLAFQEAATASSGRSNAGCDAVAYRVDGETVNVDPPNPDGPTVADLRLFIIDVTGVDEISGTFTVEGYLDLVWCDPRLASGPEAAGARRQVFLAGDAAVKLEQIWWPDLLFANAPAGRDAGKQILEIAADGTVEYRERFSATLEARYDLRRFPFDHQTLPLVIESFAWSSEALLFHEQGDKIGLGEEFEVPAWHTASVRTRIESKQEIRDRAPFSRWVLEIDVDRQAAYYVWKILIPLVLLVAASWTVFWMDDGSLGERMGVSLTGILTVVAYQFIIDADLPQISYLTFMDAVLFASFAMMVLTIIENVLVRAPNAGDRQTRERRKRFDRTCRWLFPAAYAGLLTLLVLTYL